MKRKYHDTLEYFHRKQKRILRQKLKRKNKKYNPYRHFHEDSRLNNIAPPYELKLINNKRYCDKTHNEIILPGVFSITDNPEETLNTIQSVSDLFFAHSDIYITVTSNKTNKMDLSALIMLDSIIVKGSKYLNKKGFKCFIDGDFPNDFQTKELFIFSGLPKHLNLIKDIENYKNIEILDPFSTINDTTQETTRIIDYYNRCLMKNGYQLNNKGKAYFFNLINEIVDNARIHNGIDNLFYCGGFYSDTNKKGQLSIISVGNSIYESLNSENTNPVIIKKINKYINYQKGFFDIGYNEENSWTVYALQYKISRFNNEDTPDRGTGTIKFMEAFSNMGKTSSNDIPIMALFSGNTHIKFDGTYTLKDEIINNEQIKVIAFNKNNSLKEKPDKNYVKNIKTKFPGVIINVEFYMDKKYLEKFKEKNNEREN